MIDHERAFWAAIDARPGDMLPLSILADYLEEHSDPRAQCLRHCVARRLVPEWCARTETWDWWQAVTNTVRYRNPSYLIPAALVRRMGGEWGYSEFPSVSTAYRALCVAWLLWKNR